MVKQLPLKFKGHLGLQYKSAGSFQGRSHSGVSPHTQKATPILSKAGNRLRAQCSAGLLRSKYHSSRVAYSQVRTERTVASDSNNMEDETSV